MVHKVRDYSANSVETKVKLSHNHLLHYQYTKFTDKSNEQAQLSLLTRDTFWKHHSEFPLPSTTFYSEHMYA